MHIEKLYTYPIKALRPVEVEEIELTKHGFEHDRYFMLAEVVNHGNGATELKNVHVAHYPESVLFFPAIDVPSDGNAHSGTITVVFRPPEGEEKTITFPLNPDVSDLETVDTVMHGSPTKAYKMPQQYNNWFSSCYGKTIILMYLGDHRRPVLMSTDDNSQSKPSNESSTSWLSSLASTASSYLSSKPTSPPPTITFADCAPFLIVSTASLHDLHPRLPAGHEMDITKFRPNIVVSGASAPWDEDFWGQLLITPSPSSTDGASTSTVALECPHNCGRCTSINIDYATGRAGTGPSGAMLKRMQADRRVDRGAKYSPIFGRYAFLRAGDEGKVVAVGDEVAVGRRNEASTVFDWEGLATK